MPDQALPVVKRTYGARKPLASSLVSLNSPSGLAFASAAPSMVAEDTSTTPNKVKRTYGSRAKRNEATQSSSSASSSPRPGTATVQSVSSSPVRRTSPRKSTPPTSPERVHLEDEEEAGASAKRCGSESQQAKPAAAKGDLRSFFERRSPPKKRRRIASPPLVEDEALDLLSTGSRPGPAGGKTRNGDRRSPVPPKSSATPAKPLKLEQLYLDPFKDAGHATLSCSTCALSYARTPADVAFHDRHHKKVVNGCDWIASDDAKGVTVLDASAEWGKQRGGKVLMVDYPLVENNLRRKLKDVLETVDTELSSTSLTAAQLDKSKVFLFVTSQRKVIACAVVQRIDSAYQAVSAPPAIEDDSGETLPAKADLVRFGEEDQGAIFCLPDRLPTLLGVQRIWTSKASRRFGLASRLLDFMAAKYVYGSPIPLERRKEDVAFSQPTGKGQKLARAWTGSDAIRVFVD
ncbi:hypothetical protein JCM3774_000536 [Rhodotorula dairenensis]